MNGSPASGESKDTNIELAKAYIRYMTFKEDADFWAFEDMDDMTRQDPPRAWQMILNILSEAPDAHILCCVASGPLEDLLNYNGGEYVDKVTLESKTNSRLAYAVSKAILDNSMLAKIGALKVWDNNDVEDLFKKSH
ncbi:MAG: hypothetical protein IPP97_00310 [Candidatus Obscuribacter sp.]|nr:hypothetical protein [Candidatus Obscuribacter sp.]MBP6351399.1 hypothetical protein [Candidatus Obscuribacter sp.]MBP6592980.1 hypothetical protein [Candidatus Obscuribacter sp.]MBP7576386.1 hypothetical protein [Candidatus Obscuribacter sp.]